MTATDDTETFLARHKRLKSEREALERGTPAWAAADHQGEVEQGNPRAQAWVKAKLDAQLAEISERAPGDRNDQLNNVAFSIGRLCPKWVDYREVANRLYEAARACGLKHDESMATIRSGLDAGMEDPRDPPVSEPPPEVAFGVDLSTGEILEPSTEEQAAESLADAPAPAESVGELVRRNLPTIDWHALFADESEEEWIVEPLLPARRLVALYSAPKLGKSLLLLELCVAIARGTSVLGVQIDRPRRVLYVDFENDPKADIRERLQAMGVGPDDLENLCYLSFPNLAALDSERGGLELMAAVTEYRCEVVTVDTVSRAIAGEENENDTWLAFYRHTGLRMKQAGVSLIRLDHSGKDEAKGQRGGSAKSGDVDAVWRLSRVKDETYRLDCEASRMPITEKTLVIHRELTPLRHRVDAEGRSAAWRVKVEGAVKALDALGLADDTANREARAALKGAGERATNEVLAEAVRRRQRRVEPVDNPVDKRSGTWPERLDQLDGE